MNLEHMDLNGAGPLPPEPRETQRMRAEVERLRGALRVAIHTGELVQADVAKAEAERNAYRAEVALMARHDAHPLVRSIAAKLTARVQMRLAGGDGAQAQDARKTP